MSDFQERLKRAANSYAEGATARYRASEEKDNRRSAFLVDFSDKARNVIWNVFIRAREIEATQEHVIPGSGRSSDDTRTTFWVDAGTQHHRLVFVANAERMRVLVYINSMSRRLDDRRKEESDYNIKSEPVAELMISELDRQAVERLVADFVETVLR